MCCYGNGRRGRPAESAVREAFPTAVCELFELLLLTSYFDQQEFIKADRFSLFCQETKRGCILQYLLRISLEYFVFLQPLYSVLNQFLGQVFMCKACSFGPTEKC